MAKYYGVERSEEYLAHYGVKGMHWGVRRAIASGNAKRLEKQYTKALKKAKKLNTNANISRSQNEYKGRMNDAVVAGVTGGAMAGLPLALRQLNRSTGSRTLGAGMIAGIPILYDSETTPYVTTPVGAGLVGLGAYELGKGIAAKRRTTPKGHAKAKAKAKAFRTEMAKAFKGTKYAKLPGAKGINKPYIIETAGSQFKDAAVDSVTYPGFSRNKRIASGASNKPRHSKKRK